MTVRAVTVSLDGVEYTVKALNIGQLEKVTDLFTSPKTSQIPFGILRIALETAEPRVLDVNLLTPKLEEVTIAVTAILEMSGMEQKPVQGEISPLPPQAGAA